MNHAATALNAMVSLCILEARAGKIDVTEQLWRTVEGSRMDWFADLLADRMKETIGFIAEHDTSLADCLERLVVDLSSRTDRND